jgi:hypothetical protein
MTFFSHVAADITIAEAAVKAFIQKVVTEGEALISEVESGLSHIATLMPTIAADTAAATTFVEGLGTVAGHPEVAAAAAALNAAVVGVNEFAGAYATATAPGQSITSTAGTQAIMAGYQGIAATKAAVSNLVAVATSVAKATPPGQAKKAVTTK